MCQRLLRVSGTELYTTGPFEVVAILGKGADQSVEQRDGFRVLFQRGGVRGQSRRCDTGVLATEDGFSTRA